MKGNVKTKILMMSILILILQIVLPALSIIIESGISSKSIAYDGTEYYINTAQDLWDFATEVNDGDTFKGVTVYLTADIELGCDENNQWIPIENFRGIFNGQNHTISGMYINKSASSENVGLFGKNTGTIKNLNISNAVINILANGDLYIGIIAGDNRGLIQRCNVIDGRITTEGEHRIYCGGVCGYNSFDGTIEYCQNSSTIYTQYIAATGGIAGENYGIVRKSDNVGNVSGQNTINYNSVGIGGVVGSTHSEVYLCYNLGSVEGSNYIGGVVGTNFDKKEILSCYNLGNVNGENYVGGIVGRNGSDSNSRCYGGLIKSSYNAGKIYGTKECVGTICGINKKMGEIINCYYQESTLEGCGYDYTGNAKATEKTETEMKTNAFIELLNTDGKQFCYEENNYPIINLEGANIKVEYGSIINNTIEVKLISDEPIRNIIGWQISKDNKTLIKTFHLNTQFKLIVENYNYNQTEIEIGINDLNDTIITSDNYYIYTFEDLQILAEEVNNGNNCENKTVYLMNDINIIEDYTWDIIGTSSSTPFQGKFEGNGNKISGINIKGYSYYKGLFGYIENASIVNLNVEGRISGESKYTGGIAGRVQCSYIGNCINNIEINEEYNIYDNVLDDTRGAKVGGIVGYAWNNSTKNTVLLGCTNNASINYNGNGGSSGAVGGIAGCIQGCKVVKNKNFGEINNNGAYDVGGIIGDVFWAYDDNGYIYSYIEKSFNKGNITTKSVPQGMGGIIGETDTGIVYNNFNMGELMYSGTATSNGTASVNNIGGIIGRTYNLIFLRKLLQCR